MVYYRNKINSVTLSHDDAYRLYLDLSKVFEPQISDAPAGTSLMKNRLDRALEVCSMVREFHDKRFVERSEEEKIKDFEMMVKKVEDIIPR